MRQLLLRYGGRADQPIIASVPTSLDTSPDRLSGNELSAMNLSLPVHIDDPLERVRLTSVATAIAKEDIRLLGPHGARILGGVPTARPVPAVVPVAVQAGGQAQAAEPADLQRSRAS